MERCLLLRTAAELSETEEYPQFDEGIQRFLNNTFRYDRQKEIASNVLLVDYYETGTRELYTCYMKKREIDVPEYRPMPFEIAEHIYITVPEETKKIEHIPEGRTPRCKIVRYTFKDGLTPYEQALLFVENSQVRMIIPEYTGEDNVSALIASRPQTESEQYSFSESAGLEISDICWDWITDRCTCVPPGDMESRDDFRLLIHCFELLDMEKYLNDPYIRNIEIISNSSPGREDDRWHVYRVKLENDVNFYEGASLFFEEYNNILYIEAEQYPPEELQGMISEPAEENEKP